MSSEVGVWAVKVGSTEEVTSDVSLQRSIDSVSARLADVKSDVIDTVKSHFTPFRDGFACVKNLSARVAEVGDELKSVSAGIEESSSASSAAALASEHARLSSRVGHYRRVLAALDTLADLHSLFTSFDADLEAGAFETATASLLRMKELLDQLPSEDGSNDGQVVVSVRNQYRKHRTRLKTRLADLFGRSVVVEGRELRVLREIPGVFQHLHFDRMTPIGVILDCLQSLGMAADRFEDLASRLREHVVLPMLSGDFEPDVAVNKKQAVLRCVARACDEDEDEDNEEGGGNEAGGDGRPASTATAGAGAGAGAGTASSSSSSASSSSPSRPAVSIATTTASVQAAVDRLNAVFQFLLDTIFPGHVTLAPLLCMPLWWGVAASNSAATPTLGDDVGTFVAAAGKPTSGVIHGFVKMLQDALPTDVGHLPRFSSVLMAVQQFETNLYSHNVLSTPGSGTGSGTSQGVLAAFVSNVDQQFAYKKRQAILGQARALCSTEYHNSQRVTERVHTALDVAAAAGSAAGDTITWQVSENALSLIDLTTRALEEACAVPPSCATVLYETARDAIDIFRAVIPALFGTSIGSVPRLAMLYHNDCLYIAHHLISLGHTYRQKLPPPLNRMASFADLVPGFRTMAEEAFVNQMQRQRREVLSFAVAVSLDEIGRDDQFDILETSVKRQMFHLAQLASQWKSVLSTAVFHAAVGHLLDVVLDHLLGRIALMGNIPGPVAHQLHYLLTVMFEGSQHFAEDGGKATAKAKAGTPAASSAAVAAVTAADGSVSATAMYSNSWEKARRLADALDRDDVNHTVVRMILDS